MPSRFAGTPFDRARHFDEYLDGLASGSAGSSWNVDPALAGVARRLHAAASAAPAVPETGQIRLRPPIFATPSAATTSWRPVGGGLRRGWNGVQGTVTALLLVSLLGATFVVASRQAARQDDPAPDFDLYRTDLQGQNLSALDPLTLADRPLGSSTFATPAPQPTPGAGGVWTATGWHACIGEPDVLQIDFLLDNSGAEVELTHVIRDGRTGEEFARLNHLDAAYVTGVSDECDRIVFPDGRANRAGWSVYDTATGQHVATADADRVMPINGLGSLDPTGRRLYLLVFGGDEFVQTDPRWRGPDPYPVRVASIDLDTGAVVASADLPGVLAGSWPAPEGSGLQGRIGLGPQLALSPDGSTIAVAGGDAAAVVLLDAAGLRVIGSIDMSGGGAASPVARSAVITVNAEARAVFAPDGRSLYVSGYEVLEGADGTFVARYHPLRRLDLATGQVSATNGEGANQLVPSPDGRWLYALGTAPEFVATCDGCAQTLRRLDAETLATEAERTLPAGWYVLILPRPDA